jgi:tyrosyl-tRNA synthetase
MIVNNADWLLELNYVELLREVGAHFSVNRMLTAECYKQRMEKGLSFLEFNYMIMQSYDFLELYQKYGCNMQFGGDDQWSNIIGGVELIRRIEKKEAYAMTTNLLLTSDGKKMGKTEKGALWLDANKTSPYEFYQYFRNLPDQDIIKSLKMLTFLSLKKISEFEMLKGKELNQAKEILAFEVTKLIHGESQAKKAQNSAQSLFVQNSGDENMPCKTLNKSDFSNGKITVLDMLTKANIAVSKSEARRLVEQGGISVDGTRVESADEQISKILLKKGHFIVKKGKKHYFKIELLQN